MEQSIGSISGPYGKLKQNQQAALNLSTVMISLLIKNYNHYKEFKTLINKYLN